MKKLYTAAFVIFFTTTMVLTSCKKDTIEPNLFYGYNYFMVDSGRYNQFSVDSIAYNDFTGGVDTFSFDIREINDSLFLDNANDTTVRLVRWRRDSTNGAWYIGDVWTMNRTTGTAEKVEENKRIIKLRFPMKNGDTWNGNLYNSDDAWAYTISAIGQPYTVNGVTFPETITVSQTGQNDIPNGSTEPLIHRELGKEVYAKGVGLIYKELMILEGKTDPNVITLPFDQRIKKGFKLKMTLTDYYPQ